MAQTRRIVDSDAYRQLRYIGDGFFLPGFGNVARGHLFVPLWTLFSDIHRQSHEVGGSDRQQIGDFPCPA